MNNITIVLGARTGKRGNSYNFGFSIHKMCHDGELKLAEPCVTKSVELALVR